MKNHLTKLPFLARTIRAAGAGFNLGAMYEHGHGVAQDYAQARGWYRRAAEAGNAPAAERLYRLAAPVAPNGQLSTIQAPAGYRRLTPHNKICSLEWSKHGLQKRAKGHPGPLTKAQTHLTQKKER